MKKLVAYFSATDTTAAVAEKLAKVADADLYEIKPVVKYTMADLDWMDDKARSTVEMHNTSMRPEIITGDIDPAEYGTIYLGFPIWWYIAPTVINAFLESYDFSGKKIILFATSGGSGFGETVVNLKPSAPDALIVEGEVFTGSVSEAELKNLISA